jgi:arylsulfatase A-like enzyme
VLSTLSPLHIEPGRLNMGSMLKKHGYATAAIGKWHLGYGTAGDAPNWRADFTGELKPGPLEIGFDYHFSVPGNHGDVTGAYVENHFVYGLRSGNIPPGAKINHPAADDPHFKASYTAEDTESGKANILEIDAPRRVNEKVMPLLTKKAAEWIGQQKAGTPFFLYYTPVAVHNPITPDKDLAGKSAAGLYGDWIHELDRSVGAVLEALDKGGFAENTLVMFSSDNGGVVRLNRPDTPQSIAYKAGLRVNGDLRGSKHDVWEAGFKVPFLARWPGHIPAGSVCADPVSLADILATTAAIVGEKLPAPEVAAEDSFNQLNALLGKHGEPTRESIIVHSSDGVFAIRKGPWKYIEGVPAEGIKQASRKVHGDQFRPMLYNTQSDPAETEDVLKNHPEVVKELSALLVRYRDGGYSREMPPVREKVEPKIVTMAAPAGQVVLQQTLRELPPKPWTTPRGEWTPKDGGLSGRQVGAKDQGATLRAPLNIADGVIQYEIRFDGADRHSLRIEAGENRSGSFRVEISRRHVGLTKNPAAGEPRDKITPLARKALELESGRWYPVRITFAGGKATVQVNDVSITGADAILAEMKPAMNFLVFGDSAAFRKVVVARP